MPEVTTNLWPKKPRRLRKRSRISGEFMYTRQQLEAIFWNTFSTYIRAKYPYCVMRDWPEHKCGGVLQAGHVIPRGFGPTKYDGWNVFTQCSAANKEHYVILRNMEVYDRALQSPYVRWFIDQYGEDRYRSLWQKARRPWKDYSSDELKRLISFYQHKTIELAC